jgi:hypothetical protein
LDEIVEEVFNEELEPAKTEDAHDDEEDDEQIAGTPTTAQRKRKRDIVKRALNHIKNHEKGSTRRKLRQTFARLMVERPPVTPIAAQQEQIVA